MKTIFIALVLIVSTIKFSSAQDTLVLIDGTTTYPITITRISQSYIYYRYGSNPRQRDVSIRRVGYIIKDSKRLDYNPLKSGVAVANSTPATTVVPQSATQTDNNSSVSAAQYSANSNPVEAHDREIQGRNDARVYYRNYRTPAGWTLATTLIFAPVGLVTAVSTSITPPTDQNLEFPTAALMRDPAYAKGYTSQAHHKKSGRVWGNFGIGLLVNVAVGALILSSRR